GGPTPALFDRLPFVRYASNPVIPLGGSGSWYEEQVFDPCVLVDPSDATKLIMFVSGMASPVASSNVTVGRFDGTVANPYSWSEHGGTGHGQVLLPGSGGSWDQTAVRLGSCFYDSGTFYIYYAGYSSGSGVSQIGLATSTDGVTFTKSGSNPVLTPTGQGRNDGDNVEDPAVLKEGSAWTMIYAYRNGGTVLPGYRYATASTATAWTKGGVGDLITCSVGSFCEWHQIQKIGSEYVLIFEAGNDSPPFSLYMSSASSVTGPYSPNDNSQTILSPSGVVGAWDRYHVATGALFNIGTLWLLYYVGAGLHQSPYQTNTYPMGVAALCPQIKLAPGTLVVGAGATLKLAGCF
ncbi:MAG TPA: hypothetical protein VMT97_14810, partial [Terriglobales bacterium]|nr:hypothetical protein [Terriglobales bacterium]